MSPPSHTHTFPGANPSHSNFPNRPETVAGWQDQTGQSQYPLDYWKAGSTHIAGQYEQLVGTPKKDRYVEIINRSYDQFGHLLSSTTVSRARHDAPDILLEKATEYMEKFPANGEFQSPPSIPVTIGDWELISTAREPPRNITHWELGFGAAEFILEQTDIVSHYSYTSRPHTITYREPDAEPIEIATTVPRTQAFEIAVHTLEHLALPLGNRPDALDKLQTVTGIGPQKSRAFLLLGITSVPQLAHYLESDETVVNSAHRTALERHLTGQIYDSLGIAPEKS